MGEITVLSPVGITRTESQAIAARLGALAEVRLGLLSNNKPNSESLQAQVAALLDERYGLGGTVKKVKPNPSVGARGLADYAAEVQAVITAIGD